MSKLTIRIDNHDQHYTVSEMRKRLAQVLSKLSGDQEVTFTFVANLEYYQPAAPQGYNCLRANCTSPVPHFHLSHADDHAGLTPPVVFGELARPENN